MRRPLPPNFSERVAFMKASTSAGRQDLLATPLFFGRRIFGMPLAAFTVVMPRGMPQPSTTDNTATTILASQRPRASNTASRVFSTQGWSMFGSGFALKVRSASMARR